MREEHEHSTWSEWINRKYEEFRIGKRGNAGSISAFGRLFGAPHQVVLAWLRPGSNPPRKEYYIKQIVDLYGDESYPALGVPKPVTGDNGRGHALTQNEKKALELMRQVPVENQEDLLDTLELYLLRHGWVRVK